MKNQDLAEQFEQETGTPAINTQGEPDIDYVAWLEKKVNDQPVDYSGLAEKVAIQVYNYEPPNGENYEPTVDNLKKLMKATITQHFADHGKELNYSKITGKGMDKKLTPEDWPEAFDKAPEGLEEMATLHRKTCNIPPHPEPFDEVLEEWGDMIDRYMVSFARKVIAEKMPSEEEFILEYKNNQYMGEAVTDLYQWLYSKMKTTSQIK